MIPSAKVAIYIPEGNGRDSYISMNNGGFGVEHTILISNYKCNETYNMLIYGYKILCFRKVPIMQRESAHNAKRKCP